MLLGQILNWLIQQLFGYALMLIFRHDIKPWLSCNNLAYVQHNLLSFIICGLEVLDLLDQFIKRDGVPLRCWSSVNLRCTGVFNIFSLLTQSHCLHLINILFLNFCLLVNSLTKLLFESHDSPKDIFEKFVEIIQFFLYFCDLTINFG